MSLARASEEVCAAPAEGIRADVCVIGAGMAGAALAYALARAGVSVALVDSRDHCPPTFKAEKLEPNQMALLERLGLLETLAAASAPIGGVVVGRAGRRIDRVSISQRAAAYHDMVNAVQVALPATVARVTARVTEVAPGAEQSTATLADGRTVVARLIVLASGVMEGLAASIGLTRRIVSDPHSVAFGFTIATPDRSSFGFDALNYLPERFGDGLDYLTLFAIPGGMRANLFAYCDVRAPFVRAMRDSPNSELGRVMPRLKDIIGPYEVTSKVEIRTIDLWVTNKPAHAGLVLAGDACQSVCPATGSGLSKVLTDVALLATLIPEWLATPGMESAKVAAFYDDASKQAVDRRSLEDALSRRRFRTDNSVRMRVHRAAELARMYWRGERRAAAG